MNTLVKVSISIIFLLGSAMSLAQEWTAQADMTLKRSEAAAIEYDGQLYVFNGFSKGLFVGNSFEKYDPVTKQWSNVGTTTTLNGTAVTHAAIVLVDDEAWLIGGRIGAHPGQVSDKVWKYNFTDKTWRGGPTLPVPMAGGGAALVNNKIYHFGGMDTQARCDVNFHYVYDLAKPNEGWKNITGSAGMPSARNHFSTVVVNDIIYAIGGQHGHDGCPENPGGNVALVHSYNPQTGQWNRLADLPAIESHNEPGTFVHNGFIYTVGGATAGDKVLRFDPAQNTWELVTTLPEPLLAPVARIYNGRLVVAGGGAPRTALSIPTVRSIALPQLDDTAINFNTNTGDTSNNDNTSSDTSSDPTDNANQITIVVEAENFNARSGTASHQWVNASLPNASNGSSMISTPNSGALKSSKNDSPMLAYNLSFPQPGTYHLWVRGWGDEKTNGIGGNDSVHAGLNGSLTGTADKIDGFATGWNWSKRTRDGAPATLNIPSAGTHTVNIWMREDGFAFDQILLVNDADYVPQGIASASDPTSPDDAPVTATNLAPVVSAGSGGTIAIGEGFNVVGQVTDDGKPMGVVNLQWSKVSGPGNAIFAQAASSTSNVSFSAAGSYVLKLSANDGSLTSSDTVSVVVQSDTTNTDTNTNTDNSTNAQAASTTGLIAIEAENYQSKTSASNQSWVNASLNNTSGNGSMIATPNKGTLKSSAVGSPVLAYSVTFAQAGTYYVWIRGWGDEKANGAGGNDSVHAGLNGVLVNSADKIDGFPAGWNWSNRTRDGVRATINVPSVGTHTFNLWMREDGFAVDKIILAKAATYTPTGLGNTNTQSNNDTNPTNSAPIVDAGANATITLDATASLNGSVSDDLTSTSLLQTNWTKVSGPGTVVFANASNPTTTASFASIGTYVLKLSANDGSLSASDTSTVVVNAAQTSDPSAQPDATTIAVEAEHYFTKSATPTHQWVPANLNGASGNASMVTTPNKIVIKHGAAGSPMMSYPVNFPEAGIYHLWVRGWGDEQPNGNGTNDSVHAGLNGVLANSADKIDGFPAGWHWSNRTRDGLSARLNVPSAGIHSVNFWMREDGFAIDKFILSKDASFVPTGTSVIAIANSGSNTNNTQTDQSDNSNNANTQTANTANLVANATRAWNMVQTSNGSSVEARHEAGAVAVSNNTFYVLGGRGNRPVQSFNENTNTWVSHGNTPVVMNHFQPVVIGNKVYVIGALKDDNYPSEQPLENVYIFDTSNHTWKKGATIPLNRRRGSVGAAVYNGKIYLVGGNTRGHSGIPVNWFDEYDPATDEWRVMPNAPNARDHATIAIAAGKLVVAGGRRTVHPNVWGDTEANTDVFNFATGNWETNADDIPTERAGTMSVAVGSEVIVIGGETLGSVNANREVEAFNVSNGKWRTLQPLLEGRHSGGAVVLGDKIHVVSGNTTRGGGNESINHETLELDGSP